MAATGPWCGLGHVAPAQGDPQRAAACFAEGPELSRDAADRLGVARCLEGLAGVVAATMDGESETGPIRAARPLGSAAALREALGVPVSRVDRPTMWAEGRAMSLEQAIAHALGEPVLA